MNDYRIITPIVVMSLLIAGCLSDDKDEEAGKLTLTIELEETEGNVTQLNISVVLSNIGGSSIEIQPSFWIFTNITRVFQSENLTLPSSGSSRLSGETPRTIEAGEEIVIPWVIRLSEPYDDEQIEITFYFSFGYDAEEDDEPKQKIDSNTITISGNQDTAGEIMGDW